MKKPFSVWSILVLYAISVIGWVHNIGLFTFTFSISNGGNDVDLFRLVLLVLQSILLPVLGLIMCMHLLRGNAATQKWGYTYCGINLVCSIVSLNFSNLLICVATVVLLNSKETKDFLRNIESVTSPSAETKTGHWKRFLPIGLSSAMVFGVLTAKAMVELGDERIFQVFLPALMLTFTTTLALSAPRSSLKMLVAFTLNFIFCSAPLLMAIWVSAPAYVMLLLLAAIELLYIVLMLRRCLFAFYKRMKQNSIAVAEQPTDVLPPEEK